MGSIVAVVGATGAVGREILRQLEQRNFPCEGVVAIASERSVGKTVPFKGHEIPVHALTGEEDFAGVSLALFSAGAAQARDHAPRAVQAGAVVVDNSSFWRLDPQVPLIVTEVNPEALVGLERGIVANPNCTTMVAMLPLKALHNTFGLRSIVVTSFQAAGGAGQRGMDELMAQIATLSAQRKRLVADGAAAAGMVTPIVHAKPLAFNIVPHVGRADDSGYTDEELKLQNESRKILDLPHLTVSPTCVRVPVMVGHAVAVRATFTQIVTIAAARIALERFPGLIVTDVPTPLEWAGRDEVAVGRLRTDLSDPCTLNFFVVGDNLLKGAALNTVQIAELVVRRGIA